MCPLWRKVNFAQAIHGDSILKRIFIIMIMMIIIIIKI